MCGFIVSRDAADHTYIARRGPDGFRTLEFEGWRFAHFLLSITGEHTLQPFQDGDVLCVYNGEIYNHAYKRTDGEVLIPLYREHGVEFPRMLDGEFAIALFDFAAGLAVFSTDTFRTKPLWLGSRGVASYRSGVPDGVPVPPNTIIVRDLRSGDERRLPLTQFDFHNQHKSGYDDWIVAFERAVRKRAARNCFIGLSSGYDSGAIDCCVRKLGVPGYRAYSIAGAEDGEILRQRNGTPLTFSAREYEEKRVEVKQRVEEFPYDYFGFTGSVTEDPAAVGLAFIFSAALQERRKVYLSGQGADEIISDYALFPRQSEFKGTFPDELAGPWRNFFGNCQEAYLAKEEYVSGGYGIEGRYPFLDLEVVQEFLWLTAAAKNRHYKAPIREYLIRNGYPFHEGVKIGFEPQRLLGG